MRLSDSVKIALGGAILAGALFIWLRGQWRRAELANYLKGL